MSPGKKKTRICFWLYRKCCNHFGITASAQVVAIGRGKKGSMAGCLFFFCSLHQKKKRKFQCLLEKTWTRREQNTFQPIPSLFLCSLCYTSLVDFQSFCWLKLVQFKLYSWLSTPICSSEGNLRMLPTTGEFRQEEVEEHRSFFYSVSCFPARWWTSLINKNKNAYNLFSLPWQNK